MRRVLCGGDWTSALVVGGCKEHNAQNMDDPDTTRQNGGSSVEGPDSARKRSFAAG